MLIPTENEFQVTRGGLSMFDLTWNTIVHQVKSFILWNYGWQRSAERLRGGTVSVKWRDPDTGLWYREGTAMKILSAEVMAPYDRV